MGHGNQRTLEMTHDGHWWAVTVQTAHDWAKTSARTEHSDSRGPLCWGVTRRHEFQPCDKPPRLDHSPI